MASLDRGLPDFKNPPLTEVAISIQFDPLPNLQAPQIGLLWSIFRERFPKTEQHSLLNPVVERFGPPSQPKTQLEISNVPPVPRCCFLNEAGSELIQVQLDRFTHNWRKIKLEDEYPRYARIREQFLEELTEFCTFLQDERLGEFKPNQCEISYINHIESSDIWGTHSQLGKVLAMWKPRYSDDFLSEPESIRIATQHVFNNHEDNPMGRLHISAQPAFSVSNNKPVFIISLTARGVPDEQNSKGVLAFMDKGREMIVRGFTSITTPAMHEFWGRTR